MGRISMPIMNKTGYSMYWNSMWDDKLNYSRSFKEDVFIKIFFNLFIEGRYFFLYQYKYKDSDNLLNFLKKKYNLHIIKIKKDENKYHHLINFQKNSEPYLSKIWLIKYQTWVILYFFTYTFSNSIFTKKKKKLKKKGSKKYFDILINYYYNLLKMDYNYKIYNNYLKNKFSF